MIQSTCCSIDTIMFDSTEGLPGPVTMKRFGNPTDATSRTSNLAQQSNGPLPSTGIAIAGLLTLAAATIGIGTTARVAARRRTDHVTNDGAAG